MDHICKICVLFLIAALCVSHGTGMSLRSVPQAPMAKIMNGAISTDGDHPYIVSIQYLYKREGSVSFYIPFCGGVILDHRTIITAAHCFTDRARCWGDQPDCFRVVAGEYNLTHEDPTREQTETFSYSAVVQHEDFDEFHYDNDLALIHLETPLKYTPYVKRIRLVDPGVKYQDVATVAGWGSTLHELQSKILQEAQVTIYSNDFCENQWGDDYHAREMICAGSTVSQSGTDLVPDACFGDSGGPLVARDASKPTRKYLIGLVSWGYECGYKEYPGLYVRLSSYLKWISDRRLERLHVISNKNNVGA